MPEYSRGTLVLETSVGRLVYFLENIESIEHETPVEDDDDIVNPIRSFHYKREFNIKMKMKPGLEPTVTVIKERV
jgi:hypothetical protein